MRKVRLSKCSIGEAEKQAVLRAMEKEYLGMGEEVMLFECDIKNYLASDKDVVCVNTGTSALHIALLALGIGVGDEVLIPSITYIASFQAVSATGATPIACDVNPSTLFLDPSEIKKRATKNTKAVMPVHYASSSKGIEDIYAVAKELGIRVIEDAAQAFGGKRDNKLIGVDGDIVCFSFDGIKNITSAEGGAVLSSDKALIAKIQDARLLGVEKDTEKRYSGSRSWEFDVKEQGFRYHMSNLMAAIGRAQLLRIEEFADKRRMIAKRYAKMLSSVSKIMLLDFDYNDVLPHIFVIKAENRDLLREFLISNGIECGIHYKPNHLLTKYKSLYSLPIAESAYEKVLTLPCHYDLTDEEQDYVISKIKEFYA